MHFVFRYKSGDRFRCTLLIGAADIIEFALPFLFYFIARVFVGSSCHGQPRRIGRRPQHSIIIIRIAKLRRHCACIP
ncbi:hypothetical protein K443DRAFT_618175 [Laccaria amethystina LaAM-08-1]|uniref:Uncharacterized protein n=1 Tax=Laccaria amethystina LaAM-08-1 TaxID=1095629 RepID=A0A0C9X4Y8_9AGAR|nr:hypothetical protein K443DRAFT_618175 [Laccaria amethystina LaAM-08-1]